MSLFANYLLSAGDFFQAGYHFAGFAGDNAALSPTFCERVKVVREIIMDFPNNFYFLLMQINSVPVRNTNFLSNATAL